MSLAEVRPCGSDVAAYALGALDPSELAEFEVHLGRCAVCRDELVAFRQIVDTLPLVAPHQQPPKALRRRILAGVRDDAAVATNRRRAAEARRRLAAGPRGRVRLGRPAFGMAMAAVAAVAVLAAVALNGGNSTRVVSAAVYGSSARAQVHLTAGHAELTVEHLASPANGHIYEVWLERGSAAPQATKALFGVTRTGSGDVDVPGSMHGVTRVLVTQEPNGGSPAPTTSPVIIANL